MKKADFLFTETEYATFVGKSRAWARRERRLGRGPVVTFVGKSPMYDRSDISAWMASQRITPGGKPIAP